MKAADKISKINDLKVEEVGEPQEDKLTAKDPEDNFVNLRIEAEINDLKQMTALRKNVVHKMIYFLFFYTIFCAIVTILAGFEQTGFKLDIKVILTLWSGAFGQVIGVITLIIKGLFFIRRK